MPEFVCVKSALKELVVDASLQQLEGVLRFVQDDMCQCRLSSEDAFKLITIAEEVFTNIASYAYEEGKKGRVKILLQCDGNFYYVTFVDTGKPYDPLLKEDPDISLPLAKRDIGGLGVFLVKKLANNVTYQRQENQNILQISVRVTKEKKEPKI